ncbi:hypothetical protein Glove_471g10 [Diversispora epigaea]|uniref:Uncharacterized protein n=1 Tax=Diversispora epigaea TaxID=1348612 RepID=A0A397GN85_9GLOM|nr:hypothetical protein Glove_471g10 [Diversispora epigaea]
MKTKNNRPCSIKNCTYTNTKFRLITKFAYEKCYEKQMLQIFPYLEVGKQLCHPHYCNIVEVDRGQRRRNKKEKNTQKRKPLESIELISNNTNTELDPAKFKNIIESACPQLNGFFNYLVNTIIPKERSAYNKNEAKKSIVGLCYLIAGLRNKFVNQHKLEVGLYLMASGATWEAIDTISSLGYSACAKTIEEYRKKIQKEHIINIENYFIKNVKIDNYHSIHENRRPNTVSTLTAKHFVTCVAKPIINCSSLPLMFNKMSIHNPANVEASRICWYLIHQYIGVFDRSYSECKTQWISEHLSSINQFDRIELLTIHNYNDNIKERKIERSMKDLQLLGFNEQNLHSMQDYLNALKIIISINNKTQHLNGQIAPVVADWPGQIFIRKALYTQLPLEFQPFYLQIKLFISIMGPLHLSLNSREQVVLVHHSFFEKLFHFVFGQNKKLAKKPRPWRINLLAGLFEKYIETVFQIWTFALRWKRKNYNKAPLIFLSDIFYWKENHSLFYNLLQNQLPSFNDYYVENTHSKIRANTSANATVENIIKQAYVIMNHNPMFKDTYCKTRHYPYNIPIRDGAIFYYDIPMTDRKIWFLATR